MATNIHRHKSQEDIVVRLRTLVIAAAASGAAGVIIGVRLGRWAFRQSLVKAIQRAGQINRAYTNAAAAFPKAETVTIDRVRITLTPIGGESLDLMSSGSAIGLKGVRFGPKLASVFEVVSGGALVIEDGEGVTRLAGNQDAVVLPALGNPEDVTVEKVSALLRELADHHPGVEFLRPYRIGGDERLVSATIGGKAVELVPESAEPLPGRIIVRGLPLTSTAANKFGEATKGQFVMELVQAGPYVGAILIQSDTEDGSDQPRGDDPRISDMIPVLQEVFAED